MSQSPGGSNYSKYLNETGKSALLVTVSVARRLNLLEMKMFSEGKSPNKVSVARRLNLLEIYNQCLRVPTAHLSQSPGGSIYSKSDWSSLKRPVKKVSVARRLNLLEINSKEQKHDR